MEMKYPEHKHPHGVGDTQANPFRIWVCEECDIAFTDEEIRKDLVKGEWGHICPATKKPCRCESHLEPYIPEIKPDKGGGG